MSAQSIYITCNTERVTRTLVIAAALGVLNASLPGRPATSAAQVPEQQNTSSPWSWQCTESFVALRHADNIVWQFNYGQDLDVPYFHPLSTAAGQLLSQDRPPDHVWHHGLWLCWKFINGVNYWEPNRQTGRPDGRTSWSVTKVDTHEDGSAVIAIELRYHPAQADGENDVVLREQRRIEISAPDSQGQYHLDWTSLFTAVAERVVLDRVPPQEQSWGGYAGLSIRFAKGFAERKAVSSEGAAEFGEGGRHRSHAAAMDYGGVVDGQPVGVAFLDHPDNPRHPTPWYLIRSPEMTYINAALLAEEPLELKAGDCFTLRYRLIVHPRRWDTQQLQEAQAQFTRRKLAPLTN